jgi:hypothetical protein
LLYVIAPGASFSGSSTNAVLPLQQSQTVVLTNWPSGMFCVEWYDPATAATVGYSQAATTNGSLTLPLPDFREDLAGIVYPPPAMRTVGMDLAGAFRFELDSETGGRYFIETSSDLSTWSAFLTITNGQGIFSMADPSAKMNPQAFFRAKQDR